MFKVVFLTETFLSALRKAISFELKKNENVNVNSINKL